MTSRIDALLEFLRRAIVEPLSRSATLLGSAAQALFTASSRLRGRLVFTALLGVIAYGLYAHPPFTSVRQSEVLVRTNVLDGSARAYTRARS